MGCQRVQRRAMHRDWPVARERVQGARHRHRSSRNLGGPGQVLIPIPRVTPRRNEAVSSSPLMENHPMVVVVAIPDSQSSMAAIAMIIVAMVYFRQRVLRLLQTHQEAATRTLPVFPTTTTTTVVAAAAAVATAAAAAIDCKARVAVCRE